MYQIKQLSRFLTCSTLLAASACSVAYAENDHATLTDVERVALSEKTEVWQPVPASVQAPAHGIPSDAINLLSDISQHWVGVNGAKTPWQFSDDVLTVAPGSGDIKTTESFCDVQLHLEWRTPADFGDKAGQLRNNSGIFLQQRYEIQILDSYKNPTYPNGQAASIYKQSIPLVNASRQPGEWQSYDIIFQAPRFNEDKLVTPGYITVLHNGVLVQNHVEIKGTTEWIGTPKYKAHGCAPLQLQDHGDAVSFRNIWVRRL